jgi:hypothetical protein
VDEPSGSASEHGSRETPARRSRAQRGMRGSQRQCEPRTIPPPGAGDGEGNVGWRERRPLVGRLCFCKRACGRALRFGERARLARDAGTAVPSREPLKDPRAERVASKMRADARSAAQDQWPDLGQAARHSRRRAGAWSRGPAVRGCDRGGAQRTPPLPARCGPLAGRIHPLCGRSLLRRPRACFAATLRDRGIPAHRGAAAACRRMTTVCATAPGAASEIATVAPAQGPFRGS